MVAFHDHSQAGKDTKIRSDCDVQSVASFSVAPFSSLIKVNLMQIHDVSFHPSSGKERSS